MTVGPFAGDERGQRRRWTARATFAFGCSATATSVLLGTAGAQAEPPEERWTACDGGPGDVKCNLPRGIAADPGNGHIFVADQINRRIVEFNALGQFLKAWGWDVVEGGSAGFEVCVPEEDEVCKEGVSGSGAGQLSAGQGVALDSSGDIYVVDWSNFRVQKFSPAGEFLLMFGGGVNQTSGGDVCPRPGFPADVCGAGASGSAPGEFEWPLAGSFIAIGPADDVYVGDVGRIQRFDTEGVHQDECTVGGVVQSLASDSGGILYRGGGTRIRKLIYKTPACEDVTPTEGFDVPGGSSAVAVAPDGHVFAFGPTTCCGGFLRDPIFEFDPAGNLLENFGIGEYAGSTGLATNLCEGSEPPGNLYVTNSTLANSFIRAYGTPPDGCFNAFTGVADPIGELGATLNGTVNPRGAAVSNCFFDYGLTAGPYESSVPCEETPAEIGEGEAPVPVHAEVSGLEKATVYHFRLRATIDGAVEFGADEEFKTLGPPVISDQWTASVGESEARLRAVVNPEGLATTYRFEYVTEASFEESGFAGAQSTPELPLDDDRSDHVVTGTLKGLEPGESYRWRIVATNSSEPTIGVSRSLTTYRHVPLDTDCPNQALRDADSAFLPDCRAYEMVSPLDKNGGDILRPSVPTTNATGGYAQARPDGEGLAYAATPSFAGQPASFAVNQYIASRQPPPPPGTPLEVGETGWESEGIHPPATGRPAIPVFYGLEREFMAFTDDLCSAWLIDYQTPPAPATPEGQEDFPNLLRRDNCEPGLGGLEALTSTPPPAGADPEQFVNRKSVQGHSADGAHALFLAEAPLAAGAAPGFNTQVYDRFEGANRLVSVLPGGEADPGDAKVGSGWEGSLAGAVSADGSRVYWTAGSGELHLRLHPGQGKVAGECAAGTACTLPVSAGDALFWHASPDGSAAIYSEGSLGAGEADLHRFELAGALEEPPQPPELLIEDIRGLAGASEDLSRIYFVSDEAIVGSGANSEEDEAVAGQPNLYLWEEGAVSFIATLVEGDVGSLEPEAEFLAYDLVSANSFLRATRVSPDGTAIAFQSRAPLTDYDATDTASGKRAVEVFRYEAGGELRCVSCNPSGARPSAEPVGVPYARSAVANTRVIAASFIPTWEHPVHASSALSEDGGRLFFNSYDALVPRDNNGKLDVYEWEAAGKGSCAAGDPDFFAPSGGCIHLISTGESPLESQFWEASPDGEDVFFATAASLVSPDPSLVDLYDARIGGGFLYPEPPEECDGEVCQSPPPAPQFPTPGSSSFEGPGNRSPSRSCRPPAKRATALLRRARRLRAAAGGSSEPAVRSRALRKASSLARAARKQSRSARRCRRAERRRAGS